MERDHGVQVEVNAEREETMTNRMFRLELKASLAVFSDSLIPLIFSMILPGLFVFFVAQPTEITSVKRTLLVDLGLLSGEEYYEYYFELDFYYVSIFSFNFLEKYENFYFSVLLPLNLVLLLTIVMIGLCIRCNCGWRKTITGLMFLVVTLYLFFGTYIILAEVFLKFSIPTGKINFYMVMYNLSVVGGLAIISYEAGFQGKDRKIPFSITKCYQVLFGVITAFMTIIIPVQINLWGLALMVVLQQLRIKATAMISKERELYTSDMISGNPELMTEARSETDNLEPEEVRNDVNTDLKHQLSAEKRRRRREIIEQMQYKEFLEESDLKLDTKHYIMHSIIAITAAEFGLVVFVNVFFSSLFSVCAKLVFSKIFDKSFPLFSWSIFLGFLSGVGGFYFSTYFVNGLGLKNAPL